MADMTMSYDTAHPDKLRDVLEWCDTFMVGKRDAPSYKTIKWLEDEGLIETQVVSNGYGSNMHVSLTGLGEYELRRLKDLPKSEPEPVYDEANRIVGHISDPED